MSWLARFVRHNRIERALTATENANLAAMAQALGQATPGACYAHLMFDYDSATRTVIVALEYAVEAGGKRELAELARKSTATRRKVRSRMAHDAAVAVLTLQTPRRMNVAYAINV